MSNDPSNPVLDSTQDSRLEKQKIAAVEAAKAMAEHQAQAEAVRRNMERLRALRLAKEAEEAARAPVVTKKAASKKSSRGASKTASSKTKAEPLSQWLASQRASGRAS